MLYRSNNKNLRALEQVIPILVLTIPRLDTKQFGKQHGDAVAYGGIGSGGGVRNLRDQIVDFAGTDAYLTERNNTYFRKNNIYHCSADNYSCKNDDTYCFTPNNK